MQRVLAGLVVASVLVAVAARPVVADPRPAPTVKLVTAGKGALRPLRLAPVNGTKQKIVITSQDTTAKGLRGKLPPAELEPEIRMKSYVVVTEVAPSGDVHYVLAYGKFEAIEDKAAQPEVARQMNGVLGTLAGTKGRFVVTSRGIVKEVDVEVATAAAPETRAAIEGFGAAMGQIAQPLPEEPVGVGAKWDTTLTVTIGEMTVQQHTAQELVELDGTRGKIKLTLRQQGKGRGTGNLTLKATGQGEISFDLARPVPVRARLDTRIEVELDADGKRLAMLKTSAMTLESW